MLALVRRARRRLFYNELFAQGANASSAALLAFILLLLLGTEILAWQFAVLLPLGAGAAGLYLARRRLATPYATAQKIDRRLRLADALSTAFYFNDPEHAAKATPTIVRAHSDVAERIAQSVDVRRAIPFRAPRTIYAMAALFLVAGSLFALRYGISHRLDLKQPLASMLHQTFGMDPVQQAKKAQQKKQAKPDFAPDGDLASAEQRQERAGEPMEGPDQSEINEGVPGKMDSKSEAGKKTPDGSQQAADQQEASAEDRSSEEGDSQGSGQQSDKQDGKEGNSKQDSNNSGDNNSLMSKMKDAVQNLLSRMKPQQNQSGGQQQSGEQQGQQQNKGQQQGSKQQSAKNGQQQDGSQQSEGQEGQQGEQSQNAQDQQGKGTGNSDSKQASKQPGSGVGSQDGEKRLKAAEQLAAMGKISEIIGKRSQTISGETTVEVQSTQQTLRTQYSKQAVQHTQAGSEIGRDEIPVALQSYVEQYFEAVRKAAPKK